VIDQDVSVGRSGISIHDVRPEFDDAVRTLILSGLAEHWGTVDPTLNQDLVDMAGTYAGGRILVACDGDRVVGTGTVYPRDVETAEIVRMSVAPGYRRTGLGRRLVDDLVETARAWGASRVVLETSSGWTEVVQFYERCGFTVTHTEDGDFGQDSWFEMRLDRTD
jgi:putative acetyltransferase